MVIFENSLVAHADESEDEQIYLLAAYVHMAGVWTRFADEWEDLCQNHEPKIKFFHAYEAEKLDGQFLGVRPEFRNMKIRDLAKIIQKWVPGNIQCWLRKSDYEAHYRGRVQHDYDDPYLVLFYWTIRLMAMAGVRFNVIEPVNFIFDEKKTHEKRALNWYFQVEKMASADMLRLLGNTPQFLRDEDVVPLQSADMLGWNLRRKLTHPDEQRDMPDLLELLQPGMIGTLEIGQDLLKLFAEAVNEKPHGEYKGSIRNEPGIQ